jgi:glycosyltransferase involved in cell wall biosynthesis
VRVVHVITRLIVGGAQENTVASVLGLRQRHGVATSLISGPSTPGEGTLEPTLAACPDCLTILPALVRPLRPGHDLLALRQLGALFRRSQPDIVHTHSGKAGVLGRLAAHRAGIRIIVHTFHGPSFGSFQGFLPNLLFRAAERYAGRYTTHFVSVADAMTRQYLAAGIGQPQQYTRILSGFVLEPFLAARNDAALRRQWGLRAEDLVVGKVARLFKLKGHHDLLQAAPGLVKECPRMKFLLVGDGPWRPRLEKEVARLGLSGCFVFTGLVPPKEVSALMGIMDVVVHLSRREGLPRAVPQALAAGRPVVVADCDGASEVCLEGETGFLIRPGDRAQFTRQVLRLASDPALREQLGRRGREMVRARFGYETMVDELHRLYQKLIGAL